MTILPRAKRQMLDQALWWAEHRSAEQAIDWLEGIEQTLSSLATNPDRCVVARESDRFDTVIREIHFGLRSKATHRAVFEVRGEEVIVYCVRHLAQRDLTSDDLS